jgi:hypothetical protein
MTAKYEAKKLVDKMYNTEHCGIEHFPNKNYCDCVEVNYHQAKQCALIAVDEIRDNLPLITDIQNYWLEVKQEIQNL